MRDFDALLETLNIKASQEPDFVQATSEVFETIAPQLEKDSAYDRHKIFERLLVPDRIVQFRVNWQDDDGEVHVNNAFRVQYNNAIGPYKGGLRFHPGVSLDTFKFLGFEQTIKNALTGLPIGGGKGGADFDPKGKSDAEVMRFCQAFMAELQKYIGPHTDVPAGDIGVGSREIGYLFGAYKRISGRFDGTLTGKAPVYGGSKIREEATGYGCVYFLQYALDAAGDSLEGKRCALSGAGNVALFTAEKLIEEGAKVITLSDSGGYIVCDDGLSREQLEALMVLKLRDRKSLADFDDDAVTYHDNKRPWAEAYDIALPCATQNEVAVDDAKNMKAASALFVCEAANMPLTRDASALLRDANIPVLPSKAANAGGVAVSGLERTQNAQKLYWPADKVDNKLREIMKTIHAQCAEYGKEGDVIDYAKGANLAGFIPLADAMVAQGLL